MMILHHFTPRQSAISYHRLRMVLAKAFFACDVKQKLFICPSLLATGLSDQMFIPQVKHIGKENYADQQMFYYCMQTPYVFTVLKIFYKICQILARKFLSSVYLFNAIEADIMVCLI